MRRVLIPGRHHVLTVFQQAYFTDVIATRSAATTAGTTVTFTEQPVLVWAVTSADHRNTRRNPVPGNRREAAIERFSIDIGATSLVFLIDDVPTTDRFADHVIKEIDVQSRGRVTLTPADTVVATSTPSVIAMFQKLGFEVLPIELDPATGEFVAPRAWDVLMSIVASRDGWATDPAWFEQAAPATRDVFTRYELGDDVVAAHADPLLGDEGDLTETRDYGVYARSFDEGAERKYGYIREFVRPGRIVDVGCATGAVLKLMGDDPRLRDADLYGIEVARPLYETCIHRKRLGDFPNENTFFHHRNILAGPLFTDGSIDTTITMSLTHELESYAGREDLLRFLDLVHLQTAPGGVYVNYDVVGPDDPQRRVLLWCSPHDGTADGPLTELSTRARFQRFVADFRRDEGDGIHAEPVTIDGDEYYRMRLDHAAEFLSKKDYLDNWDSEMHERFCFFSFADWQDALRRAGFEIDPRSHQFRNEWIVDHRWRGSTALFVEGPNGLVPEEFPVTNMVLVGVRP